MAKNLIIFYSRKGQNYSNGAIKVLAKGNSAWVAEFVQKAVWGDIFEIETVAEYPEVYSDCTTQAKKEQNAGARLELKKYLSDISGYDNVFVCGPCWWDEYPMAVYTLTEKLDFAGKNVFCAVTHEGSRMGSCESLLKKKLAGAVFGKGIAIHGTEAPESEAEVAAWAKSCIK